MTAIPSQFTDEVALTRNCSARQVIRPKAARAAARVERRTQLVQRGMELLTEQAFDATGIDQILTKLSVPKGSFYHFFPSKQAFGEAVIDGYAAYFDGKFNRLLGNTDRTPLERLHDYLADCSAGMARHQWRRGCLVGIWPRSWARAMSPSVSAWRPSS